MNLAEFSIARKTSTYVLTAVVFVGGLVAFQGLGRLEDPEFTIKEAVVMTLYPGASPLEVSEEVTEVIEEAVQSMGQLKEVRSLSKPGLSISPYNRSCWRRILNSEPKGYSVVCIMLCAKSIIYCSDKIV